MLNDLTSFIGATILALILVFGALFLVLGDWSGSSGPKTASNTEQMPVPARPIPTPQ
jgi:hypothetical protein